ncbi:MAG: aspartyl protease [Oscillatoria sp. SIO1A7]|nr:aspartyl protease [Oscillatoria sp. SIO1A7]
MINGTFGENDELLFELHLIANNGLELPVEAWLDTGFSGWLAMNAQDLEALDWIYVGQQKMETAREEVNFDLYAGKVLLDRKEFDIPVHVGFGVPEILIGRQWLKSRRLVVDMRSLVLTLGDEIL